MSCPRETDLGVYVLGSLDGAERSAVEAHLAECASCRARQQELAPLPGLLGRLTAEQVEALSAPPPAVLADRIVAEGPRRADRQRRRPLLIAVAACLAVHAANAGTAIAAGGGGSAGDSVRVADPVTHVWAQAQLVSKADGTQVRLSLGGVAPETHCQIVAVAADGRREVAATWVADYQGTAEVWGTTAIPRDRLQQLIVRTMSGRVLATLKV
jgi:predicted anti-sigma-YlaC factor YlaD